ncbi:jg26132 [Pararge aegeria aegeria]|uniref:Jg26132 protein n=1 Tax=Pararge aegeria aegeria TaxID=348720 RepID=A0A8S4RXI6_9NEOP|nr:jg26132 [Pararge aegeria aegeria]
MEYGFRLVLYLTIVPVLCIGDLQQDVSTCEELDESNEVVCCDGYYWDEVTMLCKPSCRPGCGINGVCVGINKCKCISPYVWRERTCLPPITCDTPCTNGKCKDNTCTCDVGYVPKNATYCEPECRKSCINSFCAAPDRCSCLRGYTQKNQWECAPNCDKCDNGECTGPNICKCNEGYFRQGDKCVPICKGNCSHGHCSQPGECTCDAGYANHATDKLTCRPVCEPSCLNATCISPNHCLCAPGYIKTKNASVCKPKCDYCTNGDCIGPNVCSCHNGYVMIGKKCKPVCSKTCVNGFCSEPDKCTCLPTYITDDNDKFNCKPECADCENGKCTSPGRCFCNEGYERRNGKCIPFCSEPCINGYCKSPNQCGCHDGYKMNYTMDSAVCYKPCLNPCDNGICNINGECICTYGYSNDTGCLEKNNETLYLICPNEFNSVTRACWQASECGSARNNLDPRARRSEGRLMIDCKSCKGNCTDEVCKCPDGRTCELVIKAQRTGLAGLELTWILGACIGGLLFIFVIAIMGQMWRKRPNAKTTYAEESRNGSVGFTAPGTLIFNDKKADEDRYSSFDKEYDDEEEDKNEQTTEGLLYGDVRYEDEKL